MKMFPGIDAMVPNQEELEAETLTEVFDVHDTVYFIGGGPPMTITNIRKNTENPDVETIYWVTVGYFDLNNVYRRELFDLIHLSHGEDMEDETEEDEQRRRL